MVIKAQHVSHVHSEGCYYNMCHLCHGGIYGTKNIHKVITLLLVELQRKPSLNLVSFPYHYERLSPVHMSQASLPRKIEDST